MRKGHSKRLASIAVLIEGPASAALLAEQFESIVAGGILDPISCARPQPLGLVLSADSGVRLVALLQETTCTPFGNQVIS